MVKNCEKEMVRSSENTGFRSGVILPLVTPSSQDLLVNRRPTTGAGVGAGGAALIPLFAIPLGLRLRRAGFIYPCLIQVVVCCVLALYDGAGDECVNG